MVKHIVMWKMADTDDKQAKMLDIKNNLEGLKDKLDVIVDIHVGINVQNSENSDIVLVSTFKSFEDLAVYIKSPEHKAVGSTFVKPNVKERRCVDYEF